MPSSAPGFGPADASWYTPLRAVYDYVEAMCEEGELEGADARYTLHANFPSRALRAMEQSLAEAGLSRSEMLIVTPDDV